jgi:Ca2+-binding RTX toxin-like protein
MADIHGTSNNDTISPGFVSQGVSGGQPTALSDFIFGWAGDDTLSGGDGNDTLWGGRGTDTYRGGLGEYDSIAFDDTTWPRGVVVNLTTGLVIDGDGNRESIPDDDVEMVQGSRLDDDLTGRAQIVDSESILIGLAGNDTFKAPIVDSRIHVSYILDPRGVLVNLSRAEILLEGTIIGSNKARDGFFGTDTLVNIQHVAGSDYTDFIIGSSRDDLLMGLRGSDNLDGSHGNDTIIGGDERGRNDGDDALKGGEGDDRIYAGGNNDVVSGGGDADELYGEEGNDVVLSGADDASFQELRELLEQWLNSSTAETRAAAATAAIALSDTTDQDDDILNGGAADDLLVGGAGDDDLYGDDGDDVLLGMGGDDAWLTGGTGNDDVDAGEGNDSISGGDDDDALKAGEGDDKIYAGGHNDILSGGRGKDELHGEEGNDVVLSGAEDASFQELRELLEQWLNSSTAETRAAAATAAIALSDTTDQDDDILSGGAADDLLVGGAGDDDLYGDDGDDFIAGESGDGVLAGGSGNDSIAGGAGEDELYGGDDDDILVGFGDVSEFGDLHNLHDQWIAAATEKELRAVATKALGVADAGDSMKGDYLGGGNGDDLIVGTSEADLIYGSAGRDLILPGDGDDLVTAGGGADMIVIGEAIGTKEIWGSGEGYQYANTDDALDRMVLAGSPSEWTFSFDPATAAATISRNNHAGLQKITLGDVELGLFDSLRTNIVQTNDPILEMAMLATDAYFDTAPSSGLINGRHFWSDPSRGWKGLQALELGLDSAGVFDGPLNQRPISWAFKDGIFIAENATAHVVFGKVDGKNTVAIAFQGTTPGNTLADLNNYDDFLEHYELFTPLVDAVEKYIQRSGYSESEQIDQVWVTGHSLGGAMAQQFMQEFGSRDLASKLRGVTFGSPGAAAHGPDIRMLHFEHEYDPVPLLPDLARTPAGPLALGLINLGLRGCL